MAVLQLLFAFTAIAQNGSYNLRCEHLSNPMGVDVANPRLSWMMQDNRRDARQTAYQVYISKDSLALVRAGKRCWDSGRKINNVSSITYQGKKLQPFTRYYWYVKLWDKDGKPLSGHPISWFETGMMNQRNWEGSWISDRGTIDVLPAPYFRKPFVVNKIVRSARLYIVAAGLYELSINGKRVGDHRLDPMYTRFDRRNLYVTYDVTKKIQPGTNVIGVILGNGWYNHQSLAVWNFDRAPWRQRSAFCLDLRVTYEDGSTQVISTNDTWKTHTGPIIFNSIYTGEHYDSRLEIPGWDSAEFNDSQWQLAILRSAPSRNIVSQLMVPIKYEEEITPKSMVKFNDSTYLFDLGRNIAGVTGIRLHGDSGTEVRIVHSERLYTKRTAEKDTVQIGHADLSNIDVYYRPKDDTNPFQTDVVILNGKGPVEFAPKFNYKGFRYVEVKANKAISLQQDDLTAYFMHSDVQSAGRISSSNQLIDKIWWATNNSYLSNLMGYPTDCPQREKNGWTGDGHFAVETGLYNFDGITVYEKWMADHRDEQQPNGVLPDIVPTGGWGYSKANGTDWTSTIVIIPWKLYLFYGDKRPLADNYGNMKAYVDYVDRISPSGLTTFGRGDWVPVKTTSSKEYTSSVYFYADASILSKAAAILGHNDDRLKYEKLASKIRRAIDNKYFRPDQVIYAGGTQTELSIALLWHVVPEKYRLAMAANLARKVAENNMHLDVGVLGARAILSALSDNGQAETAYKLASQDTYPSWGWWIVNGATTLYENWNIDAARDISLNHMMFGAIGGWLYSGLGGIKPDESNPGFRNVLLEPNFVTGLDHFNSSHNSPYGTIVSNWRREQGHVIYEVSIPANSSVKITFPAWLKSGMLDGHVINVKQPFKAGAGRYKFVLR